MMDAQQFQKEIMDELKQYEFNNLINVFQEMTPCESCVDWHKCKHEELACYAFFQYVNSGRFRVKERANSTTKMYIKIFKENVNDQCQQFKVRIRVRKRSR